jgi:hypothetical protein
VSSDHIQSGRMVKQLIQLAVSEQLKYGNANELIAGIAFSRFSLQRIARTMFIL